MYSNSLARYFSPVFHAKYLLPWLDRLLLVRNGLKYFYQCTAQYAKDPQQMQIYPRILFFSGFRPLILGKNCPFYLLFWAGASLVIWSLMSNLWDWKSFQSCITWWQSTNLFWLDGCFVSIFQMSCCIYRAVQTGGGGLEIALPGKKWSKTSFKRL